MIDDYLERRNQEMLVKRCRVCALPAELRAEIEEAATRKKSPVSYQMLSRYLAADHGVALSNYVLRSHVEGKHGRR
jgi:hypothetical protein